MDTVGHTKSDKEYIRNQLQEDIAQDTLNFKRIYLDLLTWVSR